MRIFFGKIQTTHQLRPSDSDAEILGILLHLLEGYVHRGDVHVGDVDGHLGNVLLSQPPADSLDSLQSARLRLSTTLLTDIESDSVSIYSFSSIFHH